MSRGRLPKPTALKKLIGTYRHDRFAGDEPTPPAGIPKPPKDLDRRARAAWRYYARILAGMRVLTVADREALACFCTAAGRRAQAEEELGRDGPVVKSPSGYPIQNPWLPIANKAMEQLQKWGQELGLSPAARSRLHATPAPVEAAKTRFFRVA